MISQNRVCSFFGDIFILEQGGGGLWAKKSVLPIAEHRRPQTRIAETNCFKTHHPKIEKKLIVFDQKCGFPIIPSKPKNEPNNNK